MRQTKSILIALLGLFAANGHTRTNGSFECHFGAPGSAEYAFAKQLSIRLEEAYPVFSDRSADRTGQGKIYYVRPGCVPTFIFYEVTAKDEIQGIKQAMKSSLNGLEINQVRLKFYEKQLWSSPPSEPGPRSRKNEKLIEDTEIARDK